MPNSTQDVLWLRNRALDSTNVSVAIADARTADVPLIDVNPAFTRLTGYQPGEVIDRNCRFLQGSRTDQAVSWAMGDAIRNGVESSVVLLNYRKDGTSFWNEVNISPVFDQANHLTHFVAAQMDVTERVRNDQFRQLLNDIDGALADRMSPTSVLGPVADIVASSVADICAIHLTDDDDGIRQEVCVSSAELTKHPELKLLLESEIGAVTVPAIVRDCVASGRMFSTRLGEKPGEPKTGSDRSTRLSYGVVVAPILGPSRVFGTISLAVDEQVRPIGELDEMVAAEIGHRIGSLFEMGRLYDDLKSAIDSRDDFLSIAAHELRTPISSIKGYSQLLMRGLERGTLLPERLRLGLRTIETSSTRLTTLTNDLLEVSRTGSNRLPLHLDAVSAYAYLNRFLSERRTLQSDRHEIKLLSDDPEIWIEVDIGRLDQVMSNLVSNAVKYSPTDRPIEVEILRERGGVLIRMRDFGVGLMATDLESVFQPFQRSSSAVSSNVPGMGLGLFISRSVSERHGGTLTATSDGPGKGTTFHLWLPAIQPHKDGSGPNASEV